MTSNLPETVLSYLSVLRSYHIDHEMPAQPFEELRLSLLMRGGRRIFSNTKALCRPITREILFNIIIRWLTDRKELNIDAVFKIAGAGFIRIGEITFTAVQRAAPSFNETKVTRADMVKKGSKGVCALLSMTGDCRNVRGTIIESEGKSR